MAKNINTGLDAEDEINTGRVEINTGFEDVNTGSTKVDTGRTSISTYSIFLSPQKGQREGKASDARVKRHGLQLEQETSKKQEIDIEDGSITEGKDKVVKEEEAEGKDKVVKEEEAEVPVKKTGKRKKQKARKGINIDKTAQDEFNNKRESFVKDRIKDAS
ncbi:hypothetical protein Tco_0178593 [Tanacetum coccineum]